MKKCEEIDFDGIIVYLFFGCFCCYDNVIVEKVVYIYVNNEFMGCIDLVGVFKDGLDNFF